MIVDSYAHVSRRKYLPVEALVREMDKAAVDHAVLVQPMGDYDNRYLSECASAFPGRFRTVALPDLSARNVCAAVSRTLTDEGFAGIRVTSAIFDCADVLAEVARVGSVLVCHLPDGIGPHREALENLACKFSSLRICIPHLGWPRNEAGPTPSWEAGLRQLSGLPNVVIGISALYYFSRQPFPHADTWSMIDTVLQHFGAGRTLWASDFPLLLESAPYLDYLSLFRQGLPGISGLDRELLLGGAAARFWRITSSTVARHK